MQKYTQCVSLDFPPVTFHFPEVKATDVKFQVLFLVCCFLVFQDNEMKLGESKETHCIARMRHQVLYSIIIVLWKMCAHAGL